MTALLTDNLPLLAGAPNGIKKLRELILELAVRGKLVPQDPSDEPASELLKRIAEEKVRLVAEGKIKKPKPLAEIAEEEKLFELPLGWSWARLAAIGVTATGGTPSTGNPDFFGGDLPFIGPGQINGAGQISDPEKWLTELARPETTVAKPEDIFMVCIGGSIGKGAIADRELAFNQQINSISVLLASHRYIFNAISGPGFQDAVKDAATGSATPIINRTKWDQLLVSLPPLAEQHRIVAKVDELMALCDRLEAQQADAESAHAQLVQALLASLTQASDATDFAASWQRLAEHFHTLFTTEPSIDALKQALLQLAVMGKLVPQDASNEPASELLKRIAKEKARLVAEGKIKKQKQLAHISDEEKLFELPEGWCWTRIGTIGASATGKTPSTNNPAFFGGDLPFIGPGQISLAGQIGESEKWLTELAREETSVVEAGDILMVCIGGSIGKCAIADREMAFNQQINSIRVLLADNRYTFCTMTTPAFRASVWASASGTATPIINRSKWDELLIPLPPLAEQHRIVAKVDQLMALCDQLKTRLTQARQLNEQLASTLVEQAVA